MRSVAPIVVALLACVVATAAQGETESLELEAYTEPSRQVEVSCSRGGVIAKVLVEEGRRVKKGDVIVELVADVERAQYEVSKAALAAADAKIEAAQASVESANATIALKKAILEKYKKTQEVAKTEFDRIKDLFEQGTVAATDHDQAELNLRLAELDVQAGELDIRLAEVNVKLRELDVTQAQDNRSISELSSKQYQALLSQMTIKAPGDGEILELHKHEGEAVEEHAPLLKLVNVDRLDVIVQSVSLAVVGRIKEGMQGTFAAKGLDGVDATCEVFLVDAVADKASETVRIKARIDNADGKMPAGVQGVLRLEIPTESE